MINQDKWISSLPRKNMGFSKTTSQLDHDRWIDTIPKKNSHNTIKKNSIKKYYVMTILFVCGLLFASAVKNETRNLQNKINNLKASIVVTKFNLKQAILDNEVITSPENISRLAKEYLNTNFVSYKKNQIKSIDEDTYAIKKSSKENKKLSKKIKLGMAKKIEQTKTEIRKLQELYSRPAAIPGEIKTQVAKKIKEKKIKLKELYSSPKETFSLGKVQKWVVVQVVKAFLGMPPIPGK